MRLTRLWTEKQPSITNTLAARLRIQNHLAKLLALFQTLVRGRGLAQWETLIHHRLDLAREDVLHHLMEVAHGPHERAQERKLAGKQEPDIEAGFGAGGGAAGHQLASGLERLHALLPRGFAHMLKHDVTHLAVGDFLFGPLLQGLTWTP